MSLETPPSCKVKNDPIFLKDDHHYFSSHFMMPLHYRNYVDELLVTEGMIKDRVEKLACEIKDTYKNEEFHIICVLKGSHRFTGTLLHYLRKMYLYDKSTPSIPFFEHFIRIKSYENTTSCPDKTPLNIALQFNSEEIKGKHVLVVEDIIDTGSTLLTFTSFLKNHSPMSVKVASLLCKRTPKSNGVIGDFVGFSIPDKFVVGFGLDYNECFRDMEHIGILNNDGVEKFAISFTKTDV